MRNTFYGFVQSIRNRLVFPRPAFLAGPKVRFQHQLSANLLGPIQLVRAALPNFFHCS